MFVEIKINDKKFYRPNDFTPTRESIYAGEYTSCTGETYADYIGWKFSDMTLTWDALPYPQFQLLLSAVGPATLAFWDADGTYREEDVIITDKSHTATKLKDPQGYDLWQGVQMGVRFLGIH